MTTGRINQVSLVHSSTRCIQYFASCTHYTTLSISSQLFTNNSLFLHFGTRYLCTHLLVTHSTKPIELSPECC